MDNVLYLSLAAVLTGGMVMACLWLLHGTVHSNRAPQCRAESSPHQTDGVQCRTPSLQRGARLLQIYPPKDESVDSKPGSDVDIIAIHGLDTDSKTTWTWQGGGRKVNWLADPDMLPSRVSGVRIFTYDWPADMLQPSDLVQKSQSEFAILLFEEIRSELQITSGPTQSEERPILFIASCLGGIILMKALVGAGQTYQSVRRATRGIVFLATPFRGTSFRDVAAVAELGLNAWARIRGRGVINLLSIVKEPTFDLVQLVQDFTALCQDKDHPCYVATFYEKGKTSLPSKVFPWLPSWFRQEKLLVNESSATLDIVPRPIPLSRPHILMNKFVHSKCVGCDYGCKESQDFGLVSGKIVEMLQKIRESSPLEQADAWMRDHYYSAGRLKIERLSGALLPLERCYINLAIVERPGKEARHVDGEPATNISPNTSPFSLAARLRVETPNDKIQVRLQTLFDPRKDSNDQMTEPRRILIRGRAGVGKSTLCKKIVYEFTRCHGDFRRWNELFDRVLWIPLWRLKEWAPSQYDLEELFACEYFPHHETRTALAKALRHAAGTGRTLFILDGLDEIAQELRRDDHKSDLLKHLLNQPNVIITSRPHVALPASVGPPDLELETIGFYPEQVKEYLRATFGDDLKRAEDVQAYLQAHPLVRDLVRIPIQLDALCYTWDSFVGRALLGTMTAIYRAIEESLWKKDILRLGKSNDGKLLTKDDIEYTRMNELEGFVDGEVSLLEGLAFTGLCNDVINFGVEHRQAISRKFVLSHKTVVWDRTLPHLSFLRTSEPELEDRNRYYHFLHLTFQEYFAALYFVRQWRAKQPLNCVQLSSKRYDEVEPAVFLQNNKYDPRYDVFWRFVAGLLDPDEEALRFFEAIEDEPRDLLGPTHQRLVMHCLSEVERSESTFTTLRAKLEEHLGQWLLFECELTRHCRLSHEKELPERVLANALKRAPTHTRHILLLALQGRAALTDEILRRIVAWLEDDDASIRWAAVEALQGQADLSDDIVRRIVARLEDDNVRVRVGAVDALKRRANLSDDIFQHIVPRLEDSHWYVRFVAVNALHYRPDLSDDILRRFVARLEDDNVNVRQTAVNALKRRADLADDIVRRIAAQPEDKNENAISDEKFLHIVARLYDIDSKDREAVSRAFQRADLTDDIERRIVAQLEDEDEQVRRVVLRLLGGRADLSDKILQSIVARFEDSRSSIRQVAVEALCRRADLSDEILQRIVARLEDSHPWVRNAAVRALQGRADPSDEILQRIIARLEDSDSSVRDKVVDALLNQAMLSLDLLGPHVKPLYQILLHRSFKEHVYWCAADKAFIGIGATCVSLSGTQENQNDSIWDIRKTLGVPPHES